MKIKVTITGTIDVPDSWADGNCGELRTAEYRYNDQLTAEDALGELAEKLAKHPDDLDVTATQKNPRHRCRGPFRYLRYCRKASTITSVRFLLLRSISSFSFATTSGGRITDTVSDSPSEISPKMRS